MTEVGRVLLFLLALILCGIALLTGGCSILFTPSLFQSGEFSGPGLLPIWGTGLAIAAVCGFFSVLIFRRLGRRPLPGPETFAAPPGPAAAEEAPPADPPEPPPSSR